MGVERVDTYSGGVAMSGKQRSIRLPAETWEWIDSLPDEYGRDTTAKIYALLHKGKRLVEKEMRLHEEDDADESKQNNAANDA